MTKHTCVVTRTRLEAAGRLLRIWVRKGYRIEIVPALSEICWGELFYMNRDREPGQ